MWTYEILYLTSSTTNDIVTWWQKIIIDHTTNFTIKYAGVVPLEQQCMLTWGRTY